MLVQVRKGKARLESVRSFRPGYVRLGEIVRIAQVRTG
jgi:hypothetical protein